MKSYIAAFLLVSLLLAGHAGATIIERSFRFTEPSIVGTKDGILLEIPDCRTFGRAGEPALPVYAVSFLLPPGEAVDAIEFLPAETVILRDPMRIAPMPPQSPLTDGPAQTVLNEAVYRSSTLYPDEQGLLVTEQVLSGMRIAFITLYPCRVVPSTGIVHFTPSVTVRVATAPAPTIGPPAPPRARERALRSIGNLVANTDCIDAHRALKRPVLRSGGDAALVPYVIITSSTLAPRFEPLVDLRKSLGMHAEIVTLDSIYAEFTGADPQEQIRNFIIEAYSTWQTRYVLLGGDEEIIPHRGFYVKAGSEIETDIPSDLYYAALDGNWDTDGDTYFGEIGEEDLLPEITIGRAPVDSDTEVDNFIGKIIYYTLSPPASQCTEALMAGELLSSIEGVDTWGGDYKDEIRYGSSNYDFTTAGLPGNFNVQTLYDRDLGYSWTKSQIASYLNAGLNLVNHHGHCSLHSVMRISIYDMSLLTNTGPDQIAFICYSQGCYPAAFDNRDAVGTVHEEDAIGEELVTGPAGAAAFIGNSRLGWFSPGSTCGVSQFFDRQFFDAIFGEGITAVGDALDDSRIDNIPYVSYPVVRYVMYEQTLLGDPAMHVWTQQPKTLTVLADSILDIDQEVYTVEVLDDAGAVENARVSLFCDSPYLYVSAFTDDRGIVYLQTGPIEPCVLSLAAFAPDHYPFNGSVLVDDVMSAQPKIVYLGAGSSMLGAGSSGDIIGNSGAFNLDVIIENVGDGIAEDTELHLSCPNPAISLIDSVCHVGDLPPRTHIIEDNAFSLSIDSQLPDGGSISLEIEITTLEGHWSTQHALIVKGPAMVLENWSVTDTLNGNGNGCIDAWEFQNLHCTWRNNGSVDLENIIINLNFPAESWARVTNRTVIIQNIAAGDVITIDDELSFFIKEQAPPFSEIEMLLSLAGSGVPALVETLTIQTCGNDFDDSIDSPELWDHRPITGVDGWHVSDERYYSSPECWKCGTPGGENYSNMMDAVLVSPPLCLYDNSTLSFYHWIDAEASSYYPYWAEDAGVVEISTDNGETWTILTPVGNYPARASANNTIFLNPYQRCYSSQFDWEYEEFDLSAYHGPVLLRFRFASNEQYQFEGWYIDNIRIATEMVTDVDDETPAAAAVNALRRAYPNPFNPTTIIPFQTARREHIDLTVFDVAGRRVRTLVSGVLDEGSHTAEWDGTNDRGAPAASGVYFCSLKAGAYKATMRLVLVR